MVLLEFAEKAEEFIAQAASDGAQLVVFPEAYIGGGYPRGYRCDIGSGVYDEVDFERFRKYHASAIVVPGQFQSLDDIYFGFNLFFF